MRPETPFYVGTTRPSSVGWTRIGVTMLAGVAVALLMLQRGNAPAAVAGIVIFALLALWTWMTQHTRFIVDGHGVTVSLGGFWPQKPWPLADFRTVQMRDIPQSRTGVSVGGYGWRRTTVITPELEELTPVGSRKIFTLRENRARYRALVTRPGLMVEIIGNEAPHYLISPEDPVATAEAVDQAIRARR